MFTVKGRPASSSCALAVRAMLTSTSGGSMDTEVKELTVMPWRLVTPSKVTIATPVANRPRLPRKWWARGTESRPSALAAGPRSGPEEVIFCSLRGLRREWPSECRMGWSATKLVL